jgi:hypothetical protein
MTTSLNSSIALHSIYSILGGLSRQKPINTETLSWKLCEQDSEWLIRVQRMVMMIMGTASHILPTVDHKLTKVDARQSDRTSEGA